jgi:hypothetical protein
MALQDLWANLSREKSFTTAAFRIPVERVVNTDMGRESQKFIPRATYFEIRLSQMFIQYSREYWREFLPLASMMSEFIFDGQRHTVPIVVGPDRLAGAQAVTKGDQVEYLNTRVAGPYPYQGDDITLFAGLFRVEINNWAKRTLSLMETVADAFDATKLTSYLSIARPLLTGLESFLGMKEVEMRLGRQKAYMQQAPGSAAPADDSSSDVLQPSYEVHLRAQAAQFPPAERKKFWVNEGRLFYGDSPQNFRAYDGADFMLLRFVPLELRNDYTTFDFHKVYWKKVTEHFANGEEENAKLAFRTLAVNLSQSSDIVDTQRRALALEYKAMFQRERDLYRQLYDPDYIPEGDTVRSGGEAKPATPEETEANLQSALAQAAQAPARPVKEEDLLKALDV